MTQSKDKCGQRRERHDGSPDEHGSARTASGLNGKKAIVHQTLEHRDLTRTSSSTAPRRAQNKSDHGEKCECRIRPVLDRFVDRINETIGDIAHRVDCLAALVPLASFGFFIGTPVASDFFRLTGNPDVGAAKVFTRLSAHAVYAGIAPFEAIFVAAPILLYPIGCHLARCQFSRSGFECDQHN